MSSRPFETKMPERKITIFFLENELQNDVQVGISLLLTVPNTKRIPSIP